MVKRITAELLVGARALSLADRHHFKLNTSDLLDEFTQCKRNWLLDVLAVRQRHEPQQANFDDIQTLSTANYKLIKCMTDGRASQPTTLLQPHLPSPPGPCSSQPTGTNALHHWLQAF